VDNEILENFKDTLETLHLEKCINVNLNATIKNLKKLKKLFLYKVGYVNQTIFQDQNRYVSQLRNTIETLSIDECSKVDWYIMFLSADKTNNKIKNLTLSNIKLSDGVYPFKFINCEPYTDNLETLNLINISIASNDFSEYKKLKKLTVFNCEIRLEDDLKFYYPKTLTHFTIGKSIFFKNLNFKKQAKNLKNLVYLKVLGCIVLVHDDVDICTSLINLRTLCIMNCIGKFSLDYFFRQQVNNLKHLKGLRLNLESVLWTNSDGECLEYTNPKHLKTLNQIVLIAKNEVKEIKKNSISYLWRK
jgi:hypothetical protein